MNLPFKIYDFIGVLFPGVLALGFVCFETSLGSLPPKESVVYLAFYFVIAYVTGIILQHVSRIVFGTINLISIWRRFSTWGRKLFQKRSGDYQNEDNKVIKGRHGDYYFSDKLQKKIKEVFYDLYCLDPNELNREEVFGLVYSENDMNQREVFVAKGNMYRALAVLAQIIIIVYLVKYWSLRDRFYVVRCLVSIVLHVFLASGSYYFKDISDKIPYLKFYKTYCEQNYKKETAKKKSRTAPW